MSESGEGNEGVPDQGSGTVPVVAAVIRRRGRFLLARRPEGKRHGGMWEFPGGKLLTGESLFDGARRELGEELDLAVRAVGEERFVARDPASPFEIHFVDVEVQGDPAPTEHSEIGWFSPAELARLPLAPADLSFVREGLARSE